ncbi:MAG: aminoglycoside phosphotransferase family protein [Clostridia bacterium]|nr:aminoglycoside phosphotransferase family protein [Clostridia bacterium]
MIYSKEEIKDFIKSVLNVKADVSLARLKATGNMTARLDDGGEETLLNATVEGKDYVVKMKSRFFEDNVGHVMNYFDSPEFTASYNKGKYIFYIRDSVEREAKLYSAFSSIKASLPIIYGTQSDNNRSIVLMEKLEISRETKNEELGGLLRKMHSLYTREEDAIRLGANAHTREDYEQAKELSLNLIRSVESVYIDFPKRILSKAKEIVSDYGKSYDKMVSYPRCVCHGDLTINNMTTAKGIILYDLELATYNNPEFDLVSYLVHYPTLLTENEIKEFLTAYYGNESEIENKKEVLYLNVLLYFVTRFSAMMMISRRLDMPYMATSIKNYIYLFDYLG